MQGVNSLIRQVTEFMMAGLGEKRKNGSGYLILAVQDRLEDPVFFFRLLNQGFFLIVE
jgi:hypothetical protein